MKYLRRFLSIVYIQVVCLPVFAVAAALKPSWEWIMWLMLGYTALCSLAGGGAEALLPRKKVIWQMLLCVPLSLAAVLLFPRELPLWAFIACAVYGFIITVIANRMCALSYEVSLNIAVLVASFLIYVAAYAFLWYFDDTRALVQTTPVRLLAVVGVAWFVIAIVVRVRHAITAAAQVDHGRSLSSLVIRRNTIAGLIFIAACFALGFSNRIADAVSRLALGALHGIYNAVIWLNNLLMPDKTVDPMPTPTSAGEMIDMSGQDTTSDLGILIFNILMDIAITLVILAVLYFLGRALYRIMPKFWRNLAGFLFRRDAERETVPSDYHDVSESLFSWSNLRRRRENRRKLRKQYRDCADDAQRLRFLYRALLLRYRLRGQPVGQNVTPSELARLRPMEGMERLAESYSALRYGGETPQSGDVENANQLLTRLK